MKSILLIISILLIVCLIGCKDKWLEVKPDQSLVVPTSIADYQALMDNTTIMNSNYFGITEIGTDDFRLLDAAVTAATAPERNMYTWSNYDDFFEGLQSSDWRYAYNKILQCNIVLEGVSRLMDANKEDLDRLKGTALFFRAFNYYGLSQVFAPQYVADQADHELGLSLRTSANVNKVVTRSNLKETFDFMENELKTAADLLPETASYKTMPTKNIAKAVLARLYLSKQDYEQAEFYANEVLKSYPDLLDFNTLDIKKSFPLARFNNEVLFHCTTVNYGTLNPSKHLVQDELVLSYSDNDLRRWIYFTDTPSKTFKGSHNGTRLLFSGIALDELHLIRMECLARRGDFKNAILLLNTFLKTRYKKMDGVSTLQLYNAVSQDEALTHILTERRKSLCFRDLRWSDLRRLNLNPATSAKQSRWYKEVAYSLEPLSSRYTLPLDQDEIDLGGLQQNKY